tara:strand:- start:2950 stop:5163 length:2214 start_codon:yes stop_codon:yes gene_type:complete
MPDLTVKRSPAVNSNQRAWSQVYDDINDIIKSVNAKSTDEGRTKGTDGVDGNIRLFKDTVKSKYFIEGKFKDGWAKRELLFTDADDATQDESINFSSTESYVKPDGTVAFTAVQTGVTPSNTNHLATKGYVDGVILPNTISNPTNAQMLKYDSSASKWVNFTANFITSYAVNDSYTGSTLSPAVFGLKQTGTSSITTLRGVRSANSNMTITLEEDLSDGAYLKFNVASPTGIQSVQGYDQVNDNYASAISGNSNLKFNDAWNTGSSTGIFFVVTDSGSDTIVTPNITFPANSDTTYSTSWVDSGDNAILRLTAGGSGSGNDDLTIVKGSNITLTPSGDNLTISANNTTSYSLDNASGLPAGTQTLVMLSQGTQGIVRGLKPGSNITMSTTDSDTDTGYVTINASLSGATVVVAEANPLGGWLTHTSSTIRFIDNGKISWALSGDGATTTVTPTIAGYSAADVGALASNHAASNITSSHITVLGNTSGTNSGDVCSSNHTGAGYLTSNQTITLSGDCSGSGTTSISVTVADDSHNHTIANVDNLQTSLDAKAALAGATFTGDVEIENSKIYFDGTWASGSQRYLRGDGASGSKYIRWHWNNNDPAGTNIHDNHSVAIVVDGNNCVFDSSGNVKAAADIYAYTSSDPSLKTNKELIDNPLDKLAMIGGYSYDWKPEASEQGDHLKGHDYGVMADEIEKILPELVVTRDSGTKAVRYDKIIPLLIEAVKELNNKVDNGLE